MKKRLTVPLAVFLSLLIAGVSFAADYSYYLPYFISDSDHWSGVGLRNCSNSESAGVSVVVYDSYGNAIAIESKILSPRGQEAWSVGAGSYQEGWMKVSSDQPLIGLCFFGTSGYMADITLIDTLSQTLYVPHVAQTSNEWDTTVLVCNPNSSSTTVTLTFVDAQGNALYADTYTIQANGSGQYPLLNLVGGSEQPMGSVEISASQGIAAFALYTNIKAGGHWYAGISAVDPSGATSGGGEDTTDVRFFNDLLCGAESFTATLTVCGVSLDSESGSWSSCKSVEPGDCYVSYYADTGNCGTLTNSGSASIQAGCIYNFALTVNDSSEILLIYFYECPGDCGSATPFSVSTSLKSFSDSNSLGLLTTTPIDHEALTSYR